MVNRNEVMKMKTETILNKLLKLKENPYNYELLDAVRLLLDD